MSNYKESLKIKSMDKNAGMTSMRFQNAKEFLDRFKKLPSYNAIHSKVKISPYEKIIPHETSPMKDKISLGKLLSSCSKNTSSRQKYLKQERHKSDRKKLILKAFNHHKKNYNMKLDFDEKNRKFELLKRQLPLHTDLIYSSTQSKLGCQRMSLKIQPSQYFSNELSNGKKSLQRFSFNPFINRFQPNHMFQIHGEQQKKITKSSVRLKRQIKDDNLKSIFRHKPTISQYTTPMNQSKMEFYKDIEVIKQLQGKIGSIVGTECNKRSFQSIKNVSKNCSNLKIAINEEVLSSKTRKSYIKSKILKTETEQNKQNVNQKPKNKSDPAYIRSFLKTTNLDNISSRKDSQNEIKTTKNIIKSSSQLSMIEILHPQGQFSRHFQTQFNPW